MFFPELQPLFDALEGRKIYEKYVIPGEEREILVGEDLKSYARESLNNILGLLKDYE